MKSFLIIIALVGIVIFHTYIGHNFAPKGIDLLPFSMLLITIIIFQISKYAMYIKWLLAALLFLALDIGVKLYAGGSHDFEGLDWMNLFYFIGLILCLIIMTYKLYTSKEINAKPKILIVLLFLVFQYFQNDFFGNLGLGRYYPIN